MVQRAIDTFGRLDTIVNNAGILRDRMLINMEESEWDAVIVVHLKGAFGPTRYAAAYWRDQAKAGTSSTRRIVNTTSPSGVFGNAGQTNYGAAKAGIAAFTIICGLELARYGVLANAIAPVARTRMTEALGMGGKPRKGSTCSTPRTSRRWWCWLGSNDNVDVTGRVFLVDGDRVLGGRRVAGAGRPPATTACGGSPRSSPRSCPTSLPRPNPTPRCCPTPDASQTHTSCGSATHGG